LVLFFKNSEDGFYKTIQAIILDNNGNYSSTLDLPENLKAPIRLAMPGFRDSSFVIAQQENEYAWKVYWAEYPKFVYYGKYYTEQLFNLRFIYL
jgi:hypothetical protein